MIEKQKHSLGVLLVCVITLSYLVYPFLHLGMESISHFDVTGKRVGWTGEHFKKAFSFQEEYVYALWNSLWVSTLSTLFAAFVGVPLAFLLHTVDFPGRRFFTALAYTPLSLPPIVGMFAFWMLIGDVGLIPSRLGELLGTMRPVGVCEGIPAVLLVHTYSFSVYFYSMVSAALQRLDPSLPEAARTLGASPFQVLWKVLFPLLAPALFGAAMLSFMMSMGSFSAPYILANGTPFLSVAIYEISFAEGVLQPNYGLAAALSVMGVLFCSLFLWGTRRWNVENSRRGTRLPQRRRVSWKKQLLFFGTALWVSFLLLLPQMTIGLIAFSHFSQWETGWLPPEFTLQNYQNIWSDTQSLQPLLHSLQYSFYALLSTLAFALLASWVLVRSSFSGLALLDAALMLPLALPGTVIAFSLLRAFNEPLPQTFGVVLAHTVWLLPFAYFIRCVPLAVRPLVAALYSADPSHEEAARTLGASSWIAFRKILWPHLVPAIVSSALLIFVTCMGEFVISFMVYQPENIPLGVYIYQCMQSGIALAAAYSLLLIGFMGGVFLLQRIFFSQTRAISF